MSSDARNGRGGSDRRRTRGTAGDGTRNLNATDRGAVNREKDGDREGRPGHPYDANSNRRARPAGMDNSAPAGRSNRAAGAGVTARSDIYARYPADRAAPDLPRRNPRVRRPPPGKFDFLSGFFRPFTVFRRRMKRRIKETGGVRLYRFIRLVFTLIIVAGLAAAAYAAATRKNAGEVFVGDVRVGTVRMKSGATAEKYVEFAVNKIENEVGMRVLINEEVVFNAVYAPKSRVVSDESIIAAIAAALTYKVEAAVITVDGERFAALKSEHDAEEVKNTILDAYVQEGSEYILKGFVENFKTDMVFIEKNELTDMDRAYRALTETAGAETAYTVKSGDSIWQIALDAGMSMDELYDINPGLNSNIRVGQQITLLMQKPVLSVRTVEEIKYTEVLPKTVEYMMNSSQPRTYSRVIQQGRDGQQEVTAHVERINGFTVDTRAVDYFITVPAVNDVIEVGTR